MRCMKKTSLLFAAAPTLNRRKPSEKPGEPMAQGATIEMSDTNTQYNSKDTLPNADKTTHKTYWTLQKMPTTISMLTSRSRAPAIWFFAAGRWTSDLRQKMWSRSSRSGRVAVTAEVAAEAVVEAVVVLLVVVVVVVVVAAAAAALQCRRLAYHLVGPARGQTLSGSSRLHCAIGSSTTQEI